MPTDFQKFPAYVCGTRPESTSTGGVSGKVNVEKRTEQNWVYHLHQTAELECSSGNLHKR